MRLPGDHTTEVDQVIGALLEALQRQSAAQCIPTTDGSNPGSADRNKDDQDPPHE